MTIDEEVRNIRDQLNADMLAMLKDLLDDKDAKWKKMRLTRRQLKNECNMLKDNIKRMFVTDSKEELYEMYYRASFRLNTLLKENRKRLEDGKIN